MSLECASVIEAFVARLAKVLLRSVDFRNLHDAHVAKGTHSGLDESLFSHLFVALFFVVDL